jgi:gamma-glutamyltranspeptidase/glutathione hydrolase
MKGMVVCPQPRAADAGAAVLARGGSAFDAALTTAFAQMIADPFMCGVGGMGTLQVYSARDGEHAMLDFHATAGSRVTPDMWTQDMRGRTEVSGYTLFDDFRSELGYTAIMTPGTVAGFGAFHRRFGTLPWAELLQPAIAMAREGLEVTPFFAEFLSRPMLPGVPGGMARVSASAPCRAIYLDAQGALHRVGEVLRNPDYARTLEVLAEQGPECFYRGELGERIAADLAAGGAFVSAEDLASYVPVTCAPVRGRYRGHEIASNPPPGSGVTLIQMLQILEHFDLASLQHGSAAHLDLVARAMAAAHCDRERWLADPAFTPVPVDSMLSPERAAMWAGRIRGGELPPGAKPQPPSCTTHLCVADAQGNVVTCTHTLGTGSGVVTLGLGFVYNNSMKLFDPVPGRANSMAPGKARTTGMVPTLVLRDGRPVLAAGAPGGSVIISAVLQSIINVLDFGMSPVEAVTVPRIHCESGPIHAEARMPDAVKRELEAMGHTVRRSVLSFDPVMSRAHLLALERDDAGLRFRGGADPRSGAGVAAA